MKDLKKQLIELGANCPQIQSHIRKILAAVDEDTLRERKRRFDMAILDVEKEIASYEKELEKLDKEIERASDQGSRHLFKLEKSRLKFEKELEKSRQSLVNIKDTDLYKELL